MGRTGWRSRGGRAQCAGVAENPSPFDSRSWSRPGGPTGAGSRPGPEAPKPPRKSRARILIDRFSGRGDDHQWRPIPGGWVVSAIVAAVIGLTFGFGVKAYVAEPFKVPSASMRPTLQEHDRIIVFKGAYLLGDPKRGEVIVFSGENIYYPAGQDDQFYVKRVIATAGDTVTCCDADGRVKVNGSTVVEEYLNDGDGSTEPFKEITVADGHVFVMGDNRGDSLDSRFIGVIPTDQVVGRVYARIWPWKRVHTVPID